MRSIKPIAKQLNVPCTTLYLWRKKGILPPPTFVVRGKWYWDETGIEKIRQLIDHRKKKEGTLIRNSVFIQYVKDNIDTMTIERIASQLGISIHTVQTILAMHGINNPRSKNNGQVE